MLNRLILVVALFVVMPGAFAQKAITSLSLEPIGSYQTGVFDEGAAEIVAYSSRSLFVYVINANASTVDMLDISDPTTPLLVGSIDVTLDIPDAGGINSVAVHGDLVAVAVENDDKQANGWAAFYDLTGNYIHHIMVGALPDMITFTHNGLFALVANEGEPSDDYQVDPEGTVSIISLRRGADRATVRTADFRKYNRRVPRGVRVSGPGALPSQDFEPEYITISRNSRTAWVSLQENNAIAVIDIRSARVTDLFPLGSKNHRWPGNGLDASNDDDMINIANWPVSGLYMPDGIASFHVRGREYIITANEGDSREYAYETAEENCPVSPQYEYDDGECIYIDEARVKDIELNPSAFSLYDIDELQEDENLGRLKIINTEGDFNGDGIYEALYSYGGRSVSIYNEFGRQIYDSGDLFEQMTAIDGEFNSDNSENDSFDSRSDDKGPEPEGVEIGRIGSRTFAFVGLERVGGVMVLDVTFPRFTRFVSYINFRDFTVEDVEEEYAGDLGPEGLEFISASDSPTGKPLLVVGNEVSGSTTIYQINAE